MVTEGVTENNAPLALVPIKDPPDASVYQLIVFPNETALISEEEPIQMLAGLAVTIDGADGIPTTMVIGVLETL